MKQYAWQEEALCRGSDLDFYDISLDNAAKCIAICEGCPVKDECLEASVFPDWEAYGIWGGLRPDPRQRIRRRILDKLRKEGRVKRDKRHVTGLLKKEG